MHVTASSRDIMWKTHLDVTETADARKLCVSRRHRGLVPRPRLHLGCQRSTGPGVCARCAGAGGSALAAQRLPLLLPQCWAHLYHVHLSKQSNISSFLGVSHVGYCLTISRFQGQHLATQRRPLLLLQCSAHLYHAQLPEHTEYCLLYQLSRLLPGRALPDNVDYSSL